ncbi:MAG TPA: patatin-like phospholipase family protein [Limnochordia bacterium]
MPSGDGLGGWLQRLCRMVRWPPGWPPRRPDAEGWGKTAPQGHYPRIGLALGGGGVRGAAHIGVLQYFRERGIEPAALSGTSAGAIVAAMYGAGLSPEEMLSALTHLDKRAVFDLTFSRLQLVTLGTRLLLQVLDPSLNRGWRPPRGLLRGDGFERWFASLIGERRFDDLRCPVYVAATDLQTAETVIFGGAAHAPAEGAAGFTYISDVPVHAAVRASIAIPLLFEPKLLHGRTLVDGMVTEPVPAEILRLLGLDVVVAVDLGLGGPTAQTFEGLADVFGRAIAIGGQKITQTRISPFADCVIQPEIEAAALTEVGRIPEFAASGRRAAAAAWPQIEEKVAAGRA